MDLILVVDDEPSTCETLSDILELQGYAVLGARTGKAAKAILRSERVDAVLLDLCLPDCSGTEILRFIKDTFPEIEVLIVSGHATLESTIEAMRYGAFGYVQKPVTVDEVLVSLKRALERQRMGRELRQANQDIQERVQELELLIETAQVVSSRLELIDVLNILAGQMVRRGQVTLCHISVLDADLAHLTIRAAFPIRPIPWGPKLGKSISLDQLPTYKRIIEEKEALLIRCGNTDWIPKEDEGSLITAEGVQSALLVPMMVKERVMGVVTLLEARNWERSPYTSRKVSLCRAMASGAAIAIENALLFEERERSHMATLSTLASALDARERETHAHSQRVQEYSLRLAKELGVPEADWKPLLVGALLHDVGKIGISDTILLKPGELTDQEWREMRRHPLIGYEMLKDLAHLQVERAIVLAHHERWDGSGYPKGIVGNAIPLGARIFSVADTLDAMTSDRPYHKREGFAAAKDAIARGSGTRYDPEVVAAFLRVPIEEWQGIHQRTED